jgi:hypothetical protein
MRRSFPRQVNHVLSTSAKSSRPSSSTSSPLPRFHPSSAGSSSSARIGARPFSSSRPARENEAPRSPFSVFVETLKSEVEKDKALQGNVKQLGGEVGQIQDSENMRKAKELYERARVSPITSTHLQAPRSLGDLCLVDDGRVSGKLAEGKSQADHRPSSAFTFIDTLVACQSS